MRTVLRDKRELNKILTIVIAATGLIQAQHGYAQSPGYPGGATDSQTLSVQAKAEELFQRGDYRRAHFIYRNELAPIGDKYAHYMLGFMSHAGLGVEQDPIVASAWYRLAAERNAPEFVAIRDDLMGKFDDIDIERSDAAYIELRMAYSDIVLRMRLVRGAYEMLHEVTTGSRVGRSAAPVTVVRSDDARSLSSDVYQREIEKRMQRQLDQITAALGVDPVDVELTKTELRRLEDQVAEHVNQVTDR